MSILKSKGVQGQGPYKKKILSLYAVNFKMPF